MNRRFITKVARFGPTQPHFWALDGVPRLEAQRMPLDSVGREGFELLKREELWEKMNKKQRGCFFFCILLHSNNFFKCPNFIFGASKSKTPITKFCSNFR